MRRNSYYRNTDAQILKELGSRMCSERIKQGLTQQELAVNIGVTIRTIQRAEKGENCTLLMFVKIFRALQKLEELRDLLPVMEIDPLEMLKAERKRKPLMRVRKKNQ